MDYAWGANGLDTIITQLLNQFENTGPPPADSEKIQALPTVQVTDEHVGSGLECPVCKEDYTVGETVRQLPCNHLFHNNCIIPWLEQVSMKWLYFWLMTSELAVQMACPQLQSVNQVHLSPVIYVLDNDV
ncbi:hypothetical protein GDO78_017080 [Eleutherodactylus coqui]|nr:hypothetical protein GDO78_017080 [Eleutherodactylus coqui]